MSTQSIEATKAQLFVEPIGSDSNARIIEYLQQAAEEETCLQMACSDGVTRNMYKISIRLLAIFIINRRACALEFNVFRSTDEGISPIKVVVLSDDAGRRPVLDQPLGPDVLQKLVDSLKIVRLAPSHRPQDLPVRRQIGNKLRRRLHLKPMTSGRPPKAGMTRITITVRRSAKG